MQDDLIAVCGMNCAICSSYLAQQNGLKEKGIQIPYCTGCRERDKKCAFIKKRCEKAMNGDVTWCSECDEFPCDILKKLDAGYRKKYHMSMIENLQHIRDHGIDSLVKQQENAWACPECGGTICCHNGICFFCNSDKLIDRKPMFRWD